MNNIEVTYYAGILPGRPKPTSVFRFFSDNNKLPERFSSGGWVEDRDLMLMKMKGDITESARISFDDASAIISELKGG